MKNYGVQKNFSWFFIEANDSSKTSKIYLLHFLSNVREPELLKMKKWSGEKIFKTGRHQIIHMQIPIITKKSTLMRLFSDFHLPEMT